MGRVSQYLLAQEAITDWEVECSKAQDLLDQALAENALLAEKLDKLRVYLQTVHANSRNVLAMAGEPVDPTDG